MPPDRVSNPGPLTYESGALPIALRGPAVIIVTTEVKTSNTCTLEYTARVESGQTTVYLKIEHTMSGKNLESFKSHSSSTDN